MCYHRAMIIALLGHNYTMYLYFGMAAFLNREVFYGFLPKLHFLKFQQFLKINCAWRILICCF